jgi:uncharacterized protein with PIN domain
MTPCYLTVMTPSNERELYRCPSCGRALKTTAGFRKHLERHVFPNGAAEWLHQEGYSVVSDQSVTARAAGIFRFTAEGDSVCDRCGGEILDKSYPGRVMPGSRAPWSTGTTLCTECADHMEEKYGL